MKKVAIITISDDNNYGNRLQNYALQYKLHELGVVAETLTQDKGLYFSNLINRIKYESGKIVKSTILRKKYYRYINFLKFNKYIKFSNEDLKRIVSKNRNNYDYYIVGSDQVWNPYFKTTTEDKFLTFTMNEKRISYAASFGVASVPEKFEDKINKIADFKAISVRENEGKILIEKNTNRNDVKVHVDPTMLLNINDWEKIIKKPSNFDKNIKKRYILNYFLGTLSESRKKEIEIFAKDNNCQIINILDKNDPFYVSGPSEFLYLEKNAFLICTDSFHSSVFAMLYNRPFIIFDREQKGVESMNSRLDTLIKKFKLKNRKYNGSHITKENLKHDYTDAYQILEEERIKSLEFLKKSLDIK